MFWPHIHPEKKKRRGPKEGYKCRPWSDTQDTNIKLTVALHKKWEERNVVDHITVGPGRLGGQLGVRKE